MKYLLIAVTLFFFEKSIAQSDKNDSTKIVSDSSEKKESCFKVEATYLSNATFNGRSDSALTPYLSPTFGYYSKYGFHIESSLSYLSNSESRIDNYSFEAGYDADITDKLSASISASKIFNNTNSTSILSGIGGTINCDLSYDLGFISISAGGEIAFSSRTDYAVNMELNKEFSFGEKNNKWVVAPTASASASTLHFYEDYTSKKVRIKTRKGNPLATVTTSTTISNLNANKLTLLNYDFAVPVSYNTNIWKFYFTPTFSIPQNQINTITTTVIYLKNKPPRTSYEDSTPDSELSLKSRFTAEVGITYKL